MQRGEPEKVTGTKRKRHEESHETSQLDAEPEHETKEERRLRQNREAAQRSRKEKKEHLQFLESTVAQQKTVIRQLSSTLSDQQQMIRLLTARLAALTEPTHPLPAQLEAPTLPDLDPIYLSQDTAFALPALTLFSAPASPPAQNTPPQPPAIPYEPINWDTAPPFGLEPYDLDTFDPGF